MRFAFHCGYLIRLHRTIKADVVSGLHCVQHIRLPVVRKRFIKSSAHVMEMDKVNMRTEMANGEWHVDSHF